MSFRPLERPLRIVTGGFEFSIIKLRTCPGASLSFLITTAEAYNLARSYDPERMRIVQSGSEKRDLGSAEPVLEVKPDRLSLSGLVN